MEASLRHQGGVEDAAVQLLDITESLRVLAKKPSLIECNCEHDSMQARAWLGASVMYDGELRKRSDAVYG